MKCSPAPWKRSRRCVRSADPTSGPKQKTPRQAGAFFCSMKRGSAGLERQAVERQERQQGLVVTVSASGPAGPALAVATAAGEHALALAGSGDEGTARVAAFRTRGGLGQVHDRLAALVVDGHALGLDRAAAPARGAAATADRCADSAFGAALDGDVGAAPGRDGRQLRGTPGDLHPRHVGAGSARIREGGTLECADLRAERPLRARSGRAFQVRGFAGVAAMPGADIARRRALGDVEADRAGVEVPVARIAQVTQSALQRRAQGRLLVHGHETHGARVGAAARDEVDGCLLPALADPDEDAVALHVDGPAVDALGNFRTLRELQVELALCGIQFREAVARAADLYAGGALLRADRGGGDDQLVLAVGAALDPAAGVVAALRLRKLLLLQHREALDLEVLGQLGRRKPEVALH